MTGTFGPFVQNVNQLQILLFQYDSCFLLRFTDEGLQGIFRVFNGSAHKGIVPSEIFFLAKQQNVSLVIKYEPDFKIDVCHVEDNLIGWAKIGEIITLGIVFAADEHHLFLPDNTLTILPPQLTLFATFRASYRTSICSDTLFSIFFCFSNQLNCRQMLDL